MKKPVVAYHMPYPSTIYALRFIYQGFKAAFGSIGCKFVTYTPEDDLKKFLERHQPDLFMTASHFFYRKQLDFELLKQYRQQHGLVLMTKIDFWNSPLLKGRVNEAKSMKDDTTAKNLMKKGLLADIYYSTAAQNDGRMSGFAKFAKQDYITVPLAADSITYKPRFNQKFASDIAFVGTNLPQKREFFREWLFPLAKDYDLKLYGQDWTRRARVVGKASKVGQYFNLPVLKNIAKPPLQFNDEAEIYASAKILVNLHEDYQRQFGGDCNERTFKIPFCGGLEISDDVAVIHDYFRVGKELIVVKDKAEWFDKIRYYYDHPKEAKKIAEAGRQRVLKDHTYVRRAEQIIKLLP